MLHLAIIDESDDDYMKQIVNDSKILEDEMQHVSYTGRCVSRWLHAEPHKQSFVECITHHE
ncbi:hypothetical protein OH492_18155 [Vibrio chagasii]|nr:hypothetical protein [Vibrio chagasii]